MCSRPNLHNCGSLTVKVEHGGMASGHLFSCCYVVNSLTVLVFLQQTGRLPQVDHARAVKEYSRSSADQVQDHSLSFISLLKSILPCG